MSSVFNLIKNTVSGGLLGNPIGREFDFDRQVGTAGPGLLWKLLSASKKSSKEPATVWIFEKRLLDRFPKQQRELITDKIRHGVLALTRLRHPRILSVLHPLEESRDSLGFATEPLFTSLANALGRKENLNGKIIDTLHEFKFTETELKYGILQVCEALQFIHKDCQKIHLNIAPESIVINRLGLWKLSGFEFTRSYSVNARKEDSEDEFVKLQVWQSSVLPLCQVPLDYSSPEVVIDGHAYTASDMFSLGMLAFALYNSGVSFLCCQDSYAAYRTKINQMKSLRLTQLTNIPESLQEYMKMLFHSDVNVRPDTHEFLRISYFVDPNVASLRSLDELYRMDNLARSKFYKNLPNSLHKLPKRINLYRVFPQLAEEFSNNNMIPFVLPSILQMIDTITPDEFAAHILPKFQKVFTIKEPVQIILVLLQNLNILVAKFNPADFKTYMLPTLASALETNNNTILELCLRSLPSIAELMDYTILKNSIIPRLKKTYYNNEIHSIRIGIMICLGKMLEFLDKWCVMDDVLSFVAEIKSREQSILVSIIIIYKIAFENKKLGISRDVLASRVIPHLLLISLDSNLSYPQYSTAADLIREMISLLETEQKAKLLEIHSLKEEASGTSSTILGVTDSTIHSVQFLLSSIGFNNEKTEKLPTPSNEIAFPVSSSNPDACSDQPKATSRALTLEDKKRIMTDCDKLERLRSQPNLFPSSTLQKPVSKPLDLTSQLLQSNLQAMNVQMANKTFQKPNYDSVNFYNTASIEKLPFTPNENGTVFPKNHSFLAQSCSAPKLLAQNNTTKPLSVSEIDDLLN